MARLTTDEFERLFHECMTEAKVSASPEYMKKERLRASLQQVIAGMVASGEIKDESDLEGAFAAADMSLKALKMIPLEVWQKCSLPRKASNK